MIPLLCWAATVVVAALNFLLRALSLVLGVPCLSFFVLLQYVPFFQHVLQVSEEAAILHLAGFGLHCRSTSNYLTASMVSLDGHAEQSPSSTVSS